MEFHKKILFKKTKKLFRINFEKSAGIAQFSDTCYSDHIYKKNITSTCSITITEYLGEHDGTNLISIIKSVHVSLCPPFMQK